MAETPEESAFSRLPPRLQESFFELADHATRRISDFLRKEDEKLKELKSVLRFRKIAQRIGEDLRVGAVDGSMSPKLSERLGFRVGVYAATYMVFDEGAVISDEDERSMESGYLIAPQTGSPLHTKKILSLLSTLLERKLALKCMREYGVDLMLIDGSFYGFRTRCSEIKDKRLKELGIEGPGLDEWGIETGWDLIRKVYELTEELKKTGKVVAVIKRVRTSAIDGWLLSRSWSLDSILNRNDRAILRRLMRPGEYFDYADLLEDRSHYLHYSGLKGWFHEIMKKTQNLSGKEKLREALRHVEKKLRLQISTDLCPAGASDGEKDEMYREVISPIRLYVRLSPYAAPACIELGDGVDLDLALAYLLDSGNPATGLPFPIDLIDEMISFDRRLASEFADEIEAKLLLSSGLNVDDVHGDFESINPQKSE
ncbi:MAG: DNA double-strand break repair nuclease NurA [Thaumarchaeota archaeon]|nr:DNA double-strand break repair nuclease NurA [Nitrososphaerota archaeon]